MPAAHTRQSGEDPLERALAYPFGAPDRSYLLADGEALELGGEWPRDDRLPLLAYGSNAAPAVLAAKLGPDAEPVPVARALVDGHDAVYSAHVAAYGSVPATLIASEGTALPAFVAFVTERQVELVSRTEPNYRLEEASGLRCVLETGEPLGEVGLYVSRHGCLLRDGAPLAVAEIAAERRRLAAVPQRGALELVRGLVAPELSLAEFVADCVERGRPVARELAAAGAADRG